MKNFEWKQIDWFEADGKVVFDDTLGFVCPQTQKTSFDVVSPDFPGSSIRLANCFYISKADYKVRLDQNNITELFSQDIYVETNPPKKINVHSLIVKKWFIPIVNSPYRNNERSAKVQIDRENLSTYPLQTWFCEEIQNWPLQEILKLYQRPLFLDLQVGQSIFHKNLGKCTIVKIYEQPDMEDRMIDIQAANKEVRTIKFNSSESDAVYKIPYQSPNTNELDLFNVCKNEIVLSPHGAMSDHILNVYWLQIQDAAQYTVSLYKYIRKPYMQEVYHLKDYIAERGEGFIAIPNLAGGDYIVVVKAENRMGNVIAQSRGINVAPSSINQRPIYYNPKIW